MHWENFKRVIVFLIFVVIDTAGLSRAMDVNTKTSNAAANMAVQKYLHSIRQLEIQAGAYAPMLWEKIQGLALTYYNQGKHKEAVSFFSRALHVHRVNNGLYNVEQIPILEQMIKNHIVLENYGLVDDQKYYLYRTRLHNFKDEEPEFLNNLRDYSLWLREAYLLEIGKDSHRRLMTMNTLQTKALNIMEGVYGKNNIKILPLLDELLTTQYLIASYNKQSESEAPKMKYDKIEFDFLRLSSYAKGVNLLQRKIAIYNAIPDTNIYTKADATVALGDWYQWNKRHTQAFEMYSKAYQLLTQNEGDEDRLHAVFGRPQALPIGGIFDSELSIEKDKKKGYVVAQFSVTNTGFTREISFLDSQLETKSARYNSNRRRIKNSLKNTLFRPRFENAKPVYTGGVIHRYEFFY